MSAETAEQLQDVPETTEQSEPLIDQSGFIAFLEQLAPPGERLLIGRAVTNSDGDTVYVPTETLPPNTPLYANTGSFIKSRVDEDGRLRASADSIEHCLFYMADDIGTKATEPPVPPTWKIETSPDNHQWGYLWAERPTKDEQAAFVKAMAAAGYSDPGANNPVRWCRIPGSLNKRKGFTARLVEWHPERRFVLADLCSAMGVEMGEVQRSTTAGVAKIKDDGDDDVLAWLLENGHVLRERPKRGWYTVRCPAWEEHSNNDDSAGYMPTTRAFKCMHSHGDEWSSNRFLKWVAEEGGPEHSYGIRPELLFGNAKDTEQPGSESSHVPAADDLAFAREVMRRNGLDLAKYPHAVGGFPDGMMVRHGDDFMVEYRRGVGRVRTHGIPSPCVMGNPAGQKRLFITDDWLTGAVLHELFNAAVAVVDRWSFGEIVTEDGETSRELHTRLLPFAHGGLTVHLIGSGTGADQDHFKRLSTLRMLLLEAGATVKTYTVPQPLGAMLATANGDREQWPNVDEIVKQLYQGKDALLTAVPEEDLTGAANSYTTSNAERFGKFHLDLTDRGAGSYILAKLGRGSFYYLRDKGTWVQWRAGAWEDIGKQPVSLVDIAALGYLKRSQALHLQAKAAGVETDLGKKLRAEANEFFARSKVLGGTPGRKAVLEDLKNRGEVAVFSKIFDTDPWLLGVKNGVLDLRTGNLREMSKEDMMFRRAPVRYIKGARHERMQRFLEEITAEGFVQSAEGMPDWMRDGLRDGFIPAPHRLRWLQRRLGVGCLVGTNLLTALEILYGIGSNGKSVLAGLTIATLGNAKDGGYAMTIPSSVIMSSYAPADPNAATPFLAATAGVRALWLGEARETDKMNEQLVKLITGGDEIPTRGLYKDPMTFLPQFTPFLLTNHLPEIVEGGAAIWDRLAPLHLKCRWKRPGSDEKGEGLPPEDRWFKDDAPADDDAREFLLAWLVEGVLDYRREGLGEAPDDVKASIVHYRTASNVLAVWMADERYVLGSETDFVASGDLYQSYSAWCHKNGKKTVASNSFTKRLIENFPSLRAGKEARDLRVIYGLRWARCDE